MYTTPTFAGSGLTERQRTAPVVSRATPPNPVATRHQEPLVQCTSDNYNPTICVDGQGTGSTNNRQVVCTHDLENTWPVSSIEYILPPVPMGMATIVRWLTALVEKIRSTLK